MINLSNDEALGAAAIAAHKFSFKNREYLWGRYYFDTFIDKAKKGEIFKGNKILNKNSGKIGFDTFRLKLVESNLTLIPFLHDFDEVLG